MSSPTAKTAFATASKVGAWEEDRKSFFKALRQNDTVTADGIITKYPNEWKGWKSDKGTSPTEVAQESNSLAAVELLLDRGADINEKYARGWTPIMTAYKNKQQDIFDSLLQRGANLDQKAITRPEGSFSSAYDTSLLHMAVKANDKDTIVRLLEHGADPKTSAHYITLDLSIIGIWASYGSAATLATKKKNFLLNDILNRADVIRADFLAAGAPAALPFPTLVTPATDDKIDVMAPVKLKAPATQGTP